MSFLPVMEGVIENPTLPMQPDLEVHSTSYRFTSLAEFLFLKYAKKTETIKHGDHYRPRCEYLL